MTLRLFYKLSLTFIIAGLSLTALLIIADAIPTTAIADNVEQSASTLAAEGEYPGISRFITLSNYSDMWMLDEAATVNNGKPWDSAVMAYYYFGDNHADFTGGTVSHLRGSESEYYLGSYGRYWHGYLVFLRPLLVIFDWDGIRMLNFVLLSAMSAICFVLLYKRFSRVYAWSFAISLVVSTCFVAFMSVHLAVCWYLALGAMTAFLIWPGLLKTQTRRLDSFLVLGMCTAFFDLMTTPMLVLCYPLIVAVAIGPKDTRRFTSIAALCASWLMGYALMWLAKWVIFSIYSGYDMIGEAVSQIWMRTVSAIGSDRFSDISIAGLPAEVVMVIAFLLVAACAVALWRMAKASGKRDTAFSQNSWLIAIAVIPVIWAMVTLNHTRCHYWFTWRSIAPAVFALCVFTMNLKKTLTHE